MAMTVSRRILLYISQLPQVVEFSFKSSSHLLSQKLRSSNGGCKKRFSTTFIRPKDKIPSALSKYELFSEETAPVILDVEEERQRIISDEKVIDEFEGINLEGAVSGVFDVNELVELLEKERGEDIFVVRIPPECNYADHMVIVNGRSTRHMLAMADFIRRVYKKKVSGAGYIPKIEGKNSDIWIAVDLGNIILHVFSKAGREKYDLESLWSLGKDFDTLSQKKISDPSITDYSKILATLSPNT